MADFFIAIEPIIEIETGGDPNGGYTNDPDDPGGETKWGISKRSFPNVDINNLSREGAIGLYRRFFWTPLKIRVFPQSLANEILDFAVNAGNDEASLILQKTYNFILKEHEIRLKEDGIIGSLTLAAIQEKCKQGWEKALLAVYRAYEIFEHYDKIAPKKKMKYLKGWLTRV